MRMSTAREAFRWAAAGSPARRTNVPPLANARDLYAVRNVLKYRHLSGPRNFLLGRGKLRIRRAKIAIFADSAPRPVARTPPCGKRPRRTKQSGGCATDSVVSARNAARGARAFFSSNCPISSAWRRFSERLPDAGATTGLCRAARDHRWPPRERVPDFGNSTATRRALRGFSPLDYQDKPKVEADNDGKPRTTSPKPRSAGSRNFSRFLRSLLESEGPWVDGMVRQLRERAELPDFGERLGYDGKAVDSHRSDQLQDRQDPPTPTGASTRRRAGRPAIFGER